MQSVGMTMRDLNHKWTLLNLAPESVKQRILFRAFCHNIFKKTRILKHARRIIITIIGSSVILLGIALLVLPGPAVVVIPIGLAILATEYAWASRWLRIVRESAEKGAGKLNLCSFFSRNPLENKPDNRSE